MKILHCVSSLLVGGAEKLVKNLAVEQQLNGVPVAVLSFGKPTDEFQQQLTELNVIVYNISGSFFAKQRQLKALFNQYDVIHIHSPAVIRAFLFVAPFLWLKRVIYTIHGEVAPSLPLMTLSHKVAQSYVDKTVAVSEKTKQKALTLFKWPLEKISVVKNGVFMPVQEKINTQRATGFTIATVGRLIPLKRVEDLIHCCSKFELGNDIKIKVYGDGPEKDNLKDLSSKLRLNGTIEFMGNVSNENDIYPNFDCLIICSETEGLPMVLLEAMAYGLPCISTKVGAIPTLLNQSNSGLLYDAGNISQLAEHLSYLIENKERLRSLGQNGREFVAKEYSISEVRKSYQEYYRGN